LLTICRGWPWTAVLLISASQVARITDVSYQFLDALVCFSGRVSHFCLGLASDLNPPTSASQEVQITGMCHPAHSLLPLILCLKITNSSSSSFLYSKIISTKKPSMATCVYILIYSQELHKYEVFNIFNWFFCLENFLSSSSQYRLLL
jgi:hypothetical protein